MAMHLIRAVYRLTHQKKSGGGVYYEADSEWPFENNA
jgi:hypothetical protein